MKWIWTHRCKCLLAASLAALFVPSAATARVDLGQSVGVDSATAVCPLAELFTDATRGRQSIAPSTSIWSHFAAPTANSNAIGNRQAVKGESSCTPPPIASVTHLRRIDEQSSERSRPAFDDSYGCDYWGEYAEAPVPIIPNVRPGNAINTRPSAGNASVYGIYDEYDYEIYDEDAYWYYSDDPTESESVTESRFPASKSGPDVAELHSAARDRNILGRWWNAWAELHDQLSARISSAIRPLSDGQTIYDPYDELADWNAEYDLYPDAPSRRPSFAQALTSIPAIRLLRQSAETQIGLLKTAEWTNHPERMVERIQIELEIAMCGTPAYPFWFDLRMEWADLVRRENRRAQWHLDLRRGATRQTADWMSKTGYFLINIADALTHSADDSRGTVAERHRSGGVK